MSAATCEIPAVITTANITIATPISCETLKNNDELVGFEGAGILALDSICGVLPLKELSLVTGCQQQD